MISLTAPPHKTNKGQALIELAVILPLFGLMIGGLLFFSYAWIGRWWIDHWAYRANICMIEGNSPWQCRRQMDQKIQLLVLDSHYDVPDFWITRRESLVRVQFQLGFTDEFFKDHLKIKIPIRSQIPLPLTSHL